MDDSLIITLQHHGFSEKEAKVYLTVLELGISIASTIARRSTINRVSVYGILSDLKTKGMINEISKGDIKYYSAVSPDILFQQWEQKLETFKEKLPDFLALGANFSTKPKMHFFEGVQGIKNLYQELLKTSEPIFAFLSDDDIAPELKNYLNVQFVAQRKKHNLHASVIVRNTPENEHYLSSTKKDPLTDIRLINDKLSGIEGELMLFGQNKIGCALYSPNELIGFIIESKQLYASLKSIFMFVWNQLPGKKTLK